MQRLFQRATWSASLFALAMVGIAAACVVPPVLDRPLLLCASIIGMAFSLLIQATVPLLVVFRRNTAAGLDCLLAYHFLPWACAYGRPVWLVNPMDLSVSHWPNRYSVAALLCQCSGLVALSVELFSKCDLIPLGVILLLVLFGSSALLEASVGNSGAAAVSFVAAAICSGPMPAVVPSFITALRCSSVFVITFAVVWALFTCAHWLRMQQWSHLNDTTRGRFDQMWLLAELWLPLCFVTRFVHGGPALIRQIRSTVEKWRDAVQTLVTRARYVVIDVSDLDTATGLRWELCTCCDLPKPKVLLTCSKKMRAIALREVRALVPSAVILPDDFDCIDKLRMVKEAGAKIVQLIEYGENDKVSWHFGVQSGVFFGHVSLLEWYDAIRGA